MRKVVAVMFTVSCATGSEQAASDAPNGNHDAPDAAKHIDARIIDASVDAPKPPIDAGDDGPPDASCVPVTTQLLANPAFDLSPVGMAWQQVLIDPAGPLVTADDGVVEHSAPYKAWLGGILATNADVVDVLYQDVAIPASTTQLVVSGVYDVRTTETAGNPAYDTASFGITKPDGTPIVEVLAVSNQTPKAAWTQFSHTVTQPVAGTTIRIRMTSSNDFLNVTSFYFDSLQLMATHCP